jgi:hypothetical protein
VEHDVRLIKAEAAERRQYKERARRPKKAIDPIGLVAFDESSHRPPNGKEIAAAREERIPYLV